MSKRKCLFSDELQLKYPAFKKVDRDGSAAYCKTCDCNFSVANKGRYDIEQHMNSEKHKKRSACVQSSSRISDFMIAVKSSEQDKVSAAEVTLAFHTAVHHHSFNSVNCTHTLQKTIYPDSTIGKKIACARTKTVAIIVNVIAPLSVRIISDDCGKTPFLSISTDASNHGNLKMFPTIIQYFSPEKGL